MSATLGARPGHVQAGTWTQGGSRRLRKLALTALALASVTPAAVRAQQVVLPLKIQVRSTSDRVWLELEGLRALRRDRSVRVRGPAPLEIGRMSLSKPLGDKTELGWEMQLAALLRHGAPAVILGQGDAGETTLRVSSGGRTLLQVRRGGPAGGRRLPLDAGTLRGLRPLPRLAHERLVLAFFYGWYGRPDGPSGRWHHWRPSRPGHGVTLRPVWGYYDSGDREIIRRQIAAAKGAGIDGFILSWWGDNPRRRGVLGTLLEEAHRQRFRVSLYIERARSAARLRERLDALLRRWGGHPAFLRARGRPVVFFYDPVHRTLDRVQMREALAGLPGTFVAGQTDGRHLGLMDAMHIYYNARHPERYLRDLRVTSQVALLRDTPVVATVTPGYDDRAGRWPGLLRPRDDGDLYDRMWRGAWRADWVLITSWNEWHESSVLEPSTQYGERYLRLTRQHVARWKGEAIGLPLALTMITPEPTCDPATRARPCPPPWSLPAPQAGARLVRQVSARLRKVARAAGRVAGREPFELLEVRPLQAHATPWRDARGRPVRRTREALALIRQREPRGCFALPLIFEEPLRGPPDARRPRLRVSGYGRPISCP